MTYLHPKGKYSCKPIPGGCSLIKDLELGKHLKSSYPPAPGNFGKRIFSWNITADACNDIIIIRISPKPAA